MINIFTHEIIAAVVGDRAEFPVVLLSPHNFMLKIQAKNNKGVRGFPVYGTVHDGIVYVWPINDGSARVYWRPMTWKRP